MQASAATMSNPLTSTTTADPVQHTHDPNNAMNQLASASEQFANASSHSHGHGQGHMHNPSSFVDADAAFAGGSAYATNAPSLHSAPPQPQPQPHDHTIPAPSSATTNGQVQMQAKSNIPAQTQGMTNFTLNPPTATATTALPLSAAPASNSAASVIQDFVIPYAPPSENVTNKKKR